MNGSTLKYLFLLAVAHAAFFWKTLLTSQFTRLSGYEVVDYTYAWWTFWVRSLRQGQIPLWDPYAFCGRPFAGEMLPSAYYPLHLLFLLVPFNKDGLFSPRFFHEALVGTYLLGSYFMFALLREFRLSRFAAFIGACCFSMSSMLTGMIWPAFVEAAIWLPTIFLFVLRALRAERGGDAMLQAALSGVCFGMSILTGGLHFSILQGIFILTALLYAGAAAETPAGISRRRHWRRIALILTVILAVAGGLGAVQLMPGWEFGKLSLRFIDGGPIPASEKIPYNRLHPGLWPQSIVAPLMPTGFGKMSGGEFWGMYIGVLPFLLALAAIWKCWSNLWVRYLTVLALFCWVYALGELSLFHGVAYAVVPQLWLVRVPSRFVYLTIFAFCILAAIGMDRLLDRSADTLAWASAKRILKWLAVACASALFVAAVFVQLNVPIWNCYSLLLILASCGWFAYLSTREASPSARVFLAAFIIFDIAVFHWYPDLNKNDSSKPTEQLDQLISLRGVANFLKSQRELGRVRLADVKAQSAIGDAYGVQGVSGGTGALLTSYSKLVLRERLLNVRWIVRPLSAGDPGAIYQDWHWKLYENPDAYPRAWIVHKAVIESSGDAVFRRLDDPALDLRRVAVLEGALQSVLEDSPGTGDVVRFRSYEPNRMSLDVTAATPGMLILSELYYPGWRATANGTHVDIVKVDGALRGILIPRGQIRITLEYVPFTIYIGGAIAILTFLIVIAGAILNWRSKAKRKDAREALQSA